MCVKTVFHPTGPCCGDAGLCLRWPAIDWNRTTWLVRTPAANWIQEETYSVRKLTSFNPSTNLHDFVVNNVVTGWTSHPSEADVGTGFVISGPDVTFRAPAYWFRGGEYVARHVGHCTWQVLNREKLLTTSVAQLQIVKLIGGVEKYWFLSAYGLTTPEQRAVWEARLMRIPTIASVLIGTDGVAYPYFGGGGSLFTNVYHFGIRDVLERLACYWLPSWESRSDIVLRIGSGALQTDLGPDGFNLLSLLQAFRSRDSATWPGNSSLYKPTALDVAASVALSPGFLFSIVSDKRSPLYGAFVPLDDGLYTDGGTGVGGAADPILQSTPWQLTSGSDVVAEFGTVNRFNRTNGNDTLPAWVELELIRI